MWNCSAVFFNLLLDKFTLLFGAPECTCNLCNWYSTCSVWKLASSHFHVACDVLKIFWACLITLQLAVSGN